MTTRRSTLILALAVLAGAPLAAQQATPPAGPAGQGQDMRAQLQQRLAQRLGQMVKERLNLTDDQMKQLQTTNRSYEEKRRLLVEQEQDVRMALRDEMLRGDSANQTRVSEMLDRAMKVQRQRLDLLEAEQKDLAKFLTPMQRAKYFAIQDQMRRRLEEMRQQRPGRGGMLRRPGQPGDGADRANRFGPRRPPPA